MRWSKCVTLRDDEAGQPDCVSTLATTLDHNLLLSLE